MTMEITKDQLLGEARYVQRLCQRTSRLYNRASTCFTFFRLFSSSSAIISLSAQLPFGVTVALGLVFAAISGANFALQLVEKAAINDAEVHRYAVLLTKAVSVTDLGVLQATIADARRTDVPEIESLREVAHNDVMREINRQDQLVALRLSQRLMGAFA